MCNGCYEGLGYSLGALEEFPVAWQDWPAVTRGKNGEERRKKKERMKGGKAEREHIIRSKTACQCNGEGKGCPIGSVYN